MNEPRLVVEALQANTVFSGVPAAVLLRLVQEAQDIELLRGDPVFSAGQACQGLHVLLRGQAKVFVRTSRGQEKVIAVASAPTWLGHAVLGQEPRHVVHASMLTPGRQLLIPREAVLRELQVCGALAIRLVDEMASRLNALVHEVEAVSLQSAGQRVVAYLLGANIPSAEGVAASPVAPSASAYAGSRKVWLPASKGTIASLLSVTPEHFSRILHDLQSKGLIAVHRREIQIPDVALLEQQC